MWNFVIVFVHQTSREEMSFQVQERVILFLFKLLVDGVVRELFVVEQSVSVNDL
jgi:hypothetical protein